MERALDLTGSQNVCVSVLALILFLWMITWEFRSPLQVFNFLVYENDGDKLYPHFQGIEINLWIKYQIKDTESVVIFLFYLVSHTKNHNAQYKKVCLYCTKAKKVIIFKSRCLFLLSKCNLRLKSCDRMIKCNLTSVPACCLRQWVPQYKLSYKASMKEWIVTSWKQTLWI